MSLLLKMEPVLGFTIKRTIDSAIWFVRINKIGIQFTFNGILCEVRPVGCRGDQLLERWEAAIKDPVRWGSRAVTGSWVEESPSADWKYPNG